MARSSKLSPKVRRPEYNLVAFDPGGTIGWARFTVDCEAFTNRHHKVLPYLKSWDCGEFSGPENDQLGEASRLMYRMRYGIPPAEQYVRPMDVVSEGFDNVQNIGGFDLMSPVRINAVLDWELRRLCGLQLQIQARQLRKGITPYRLSLFGFDGWPRGKWVTSGKGKDAFAAMQHGVTWLRRVKKKSIERPWVLRPGQMPIHGSVT